MALFPSHAGERATRRIVALYVLAGLVWITCSDAVLAWLVHDQAILTGLAVVKGSLFILVTALLLWFLISRHIRQLAATERHAAENLAYHQAIFNATGEAICVLDTGSCQIVDVNDTLLSIYGCSRDEALSMDIGWFSEGTPPYSQAEAVEKVQAAVREGPQLFSWHSRKKDGTLFWTEVSLTMVAAGGHDRVSPWCGISRGERQPKSCSSPARRATGQSSRASSSTSPASFPAAS